MNNLDKVILTSSCDQNENLTLFVHERESLYIYKSRFMEINLPQGFLIIDEPSPETKNAQPIIKNQILECFFEHKTFRYLFDTSVLDHVDFLLKTNRIRALKIVLPERLTDGQRREYFRVEMPVKSPVTVRFLVYKQGGSIPIKSTILDEEPQWFEGFLHDVSGGGICVYSKDQAFLFDLKKGDSLEVFFKLQPAMEEVHLWTEVRNVRLIENVKVVALGVRFFENNLNPNLKSYRNKIVKFVFERQREILTK